MLEAIVREFPDSSYARLARVELAGMEARRDAAGGPATDAADLRKLADQFKEAGDWPRARAFYLQAAQAGDPEAMHEIGLLYSSGIGFSDNTLHADPAEGLRWLRKSAEAGNTSAMQYIGFLYAVGRGVPKDGPTSLQWYLKAAEMGDRDAMWNLGDNYEHGWRVPADRDKAIFWYRKGAAKGSEAAQRALKRMSVEP